MEILFCKPITHGSQNHLYAVWLLDTHSHGIQEHSGPRRYIPPEHPTASSALFLPRSQKLLLHGESSRSPRREHVRFKVVKADIEKKFGVNFNEYFDFELNNLKHFEAEGLVRLEPDFIEVTPKGKLLVRAVAMNFDRYLREDERVRRYSRIV